MSYRPSDTRFTPVHADGYDHALQDRVCDILNGKGKSADGADIPFISQNQLGNYAGVAGATLSIWIRGKYGASPAAIETKLRDLLKRMDDPVLSPFRQNAEQAAAKSDSWFMNNMVRRIHNTFNQAVKHNFMCGITSEPGIGKSVACQMYIREHPTYQLITLNRALGGGAPGGIMDCMFRQIDGSRWKENRNRGVWLCNHFRDSGRLIIFDNIDMLSRSGLEWVMGFYEETKCPMALVGNDDLHQTIRQVQRAPSRVYPLVDLDFGADARERRRASEYAEGSIAPFLTAHWPEAADDAAVLELCHTIVSQKGRLRALEKLVRTARGYISENHDKLKDPAAALRAAMARHVVDYKLGM